MMDPFTIPSAKPQTDDERQKRRIKEGASHGGKTHRGKRQNADRFLFGNPPKLKNITPKP